MNIAIPMIMSHGKDKDMKRKVFLLLATIMMLACTACGQNYADIDMKNGKLIEDALAKLNDVSVEDLNIPSISAIDETKTEQDTAAKTGELTVGYIEGNTYINETIGIGCTLGDSWEVNYAEAEDFSLGPVMIVEAFDGDEMIGMNIVYEKLTKAQKSLYAMGGEEASVEATISNTDNEQIEQYYEEMGVESATLEELFSKKITFAGKSRTAMVMKSKINNLDYYTLQIFNFEFNDDYVAIITCYSFIEDLTQDVANLFYNL